MFSIVGYLGFLVLVIVVQVLEKYMNIKYLDLEGLQIYAEEAESLLGCQGCIHTLPFRHPKNYHGRSRTVASQKRGVPFCDPHNVDP